MKRVLAIIGLTLSVVSVNAQTNTNGGSGPVISGPLSDAISFLGQGSNWMVAPYGIYDTGTKSVGAGVGIGYKLNDFVVPTLRLDYLAKQNELFMPSANLQLQAPVTLFGKVTAIPFTFAGIATPLAGQGSQNGTVVGIYGVGGALRLGTTNSWIGKHLDLIGDWEKWQGAGFTGDQYRFGVLYKF